MTHRPLVRVLVGSALFAACANPSPAPVTADFDIRGASELESFPKPEITAWMAYAFARGTAYQALSERRKTSSGDDFAIELFGRRHLAEAWREQRAEGAAADDYLDRLVALYEQKRLAEHVLASLAKPGWTIGAVDLAQVDHPALAEMLRDPIEAPTYAVAEPRSAPLWSAAPGADLPDPAPLAPPEVGCIESMPSLRRALSAWKSEVEQLDGAPTAAEDRATFLTMLAALPADAPQRTQGATWVGPRAYWLSFLAGFCAVELERIPEAERWLEQAVAMAPRHPTARMELVQVLVMRRKFDRADAILDDALAHSQDRCELGRAWRRRGYIRFEQRRLDEAASAYRRSLEFDPESSIARSELDLLQREIANHGGTPQAYVPPPTHPAGVTTCPPS